MNLDTIKNNDVLVSKRDHMLSFVKDMSDIEQKEFELRKLAEKLEGQSKWILYNSEESLNKLIKTEEQIKSDIKDKIQENENYESQKRDFPQIPIDYSLTHDQICSEKTQHIEKPDCSHYHKGYYKPVIIILGLIIWGAAVASLIFFNNYGIIDISGDVVEIIGAGLFFVILPISIITLCKIDKKIDKRYDTDLAKYDFRQKYYSIYRNNENLNRYIAENKELINMWSSNLIVCKARVEEANENFIKTKEKAKYLVEQAELFLKNANEINDNKQKLYEIGPVPPDYRTLDALIMIHSIFANDQADTMREATLLYDTRVYRGEVVTGLHNIYKMLGHLSRSMYAIESRLIEVRNSVDAASEELSKISGKVSDMNMTIIENEKNRERQTELHVRELIEDNQYTRNALNSLNFSRSKYDWYVEQYRQGLL